MAINLSNGLFGMGGMSGLSSPMPQQMASFYDPEQARKMKMKNAALYAGLAMLGQGPSDKPINFGTSLGQGLTAGFQQADAADKDYRDLAYQTFNINNQMDERKYGREQDAMQWDWKRKQYADDSQFRNLQMQKMQADIEKAKQVDARARLGLNPQYGVDANNNPVLLQIGEDGRAVQTAMPDGVTLSKEPIKLDAGTHYVLLDPITRQPVGQIAKDLGGAERDKAIGKYQGEKITTAPSEIQAADNALTLLDSIKNDPNRAIGTGMSSIFNPIPGTPGRDFQGKVDQATSDAFLKAIQQMEGFGALSNNEGKTAREAVTRMNTALSEGEFVKALQDYRFIVMQGKAKAQARMGGGSQPMQNNGGWQIEEVP